MALGDRKRMRSIAALLWRQLPELGPHIERRVGYTPQDGPAVIVDLAYGVRVAYFPDHRGWRAAGVFVDDALVALRSIELEASPSGADHADWAWRVLSDLLARLMNALVDELEPQIDGSDLDPRNDYDALFALRRRVDAARRHEEELGRRPVG
jgi:hypothetical protein